jgi:hypothetical protein
MRFAEVQGETAQRVADTQQSVSPGCFISSRYICFGLASIAHNFESHPARQTRPHECMDCRVADAPRNDEP